MILIFKIIPSHLILLPIKNRNFSNWDGIPQDLISFGTRLGHIFVPKKYKDGTEMFFFPICIYKMGLELINRIPSYPIANPTLVQGSWGSQLEMANRPDQPSKEGSCVLILVSCCVHHVLHVVQCHTFFFSLDQARHTYHAHSCRAMTWGIPYDA